MNNEIIISNIPPQNIIIGDGGVSGITTVYVNGVDVTVGAEAFVIVPTKLSELENNMGFITEEQDPTVPYYIKTITLGDINNWNNKQDLLVNGVNIKSINGESLIGSGNLTIDTSYTAGTGIEITDENVINNTITSYDDLSDLPTIPTSTSQLTNDSGFVTSDSLSSVAFTGDYNDLLNKPDLSDYITRNVTDLVYYYNKDFMFGLLPKVSDEDTFINLDGTYASELKLELKPTELTQAGTPTPSSPQDIHIISGDNTIKVENKNLVGADNINNLSSATGTFNGTTLNYTSTGTYKKVEWFIPVKAGEKYTFSCGANSNLYLGIFEYSQISTSSTYRLFIHRWDTILEGNPYSFTIQNDSYLRLYIGSDTAQTNQTLTNFQLEKGTTNTTAVVHQETTYPIHLDTIQYCKIGTYSDRIFYNVEGDVDYDENLDVGEWYIKKNIGKIVLDGTEDWIFDSGSTFKFRIIIDNAIYTTSNNNPPSVYCNRYSTFAWDGSGTPSTCVTATANSSILAFRNTNISTLDGWKTELGTNNVIVYYPLVNATYTQITGTLAGQLDDIRINALSYTGQTNINQVNDDLPFTISATTLKDLSNL